MKRNERVPSKPSAAPSAQTLDHHQMQDAAGGVAPLVALAAGYLFMHGLATGLSK